MPARGDKVFPPLRKFHWRVDRATYVAYTMCARRAFSIQGQRELQNNCVTLRRCPRPFSGRTKGLELLPAEGQPAAEGISRPSRPHDGQPRGRGPFQQTRALVKRGKVFPWWSADDSRGKRLRPPRNLRKKCLDRPASNFAISTWSSLLKGRRPKFPQVKVEPFSLSA